MVLDLEMQLKLLHSPKLGGVGGAPLASGSPGAGGFYAFGGGYAADAGGVYGVGAHACWGIQNQD
jgi:hypothetical protein